MIKVQVNWDWSRRAASASRPASTAADPSSTRAGALRQDVGDDQGRGFKVMFALARPAPGWATANRGDSAGVDRPSPGSSADSPRRPGAATRASTCGRSGTRRTTTTICSHSPRGADGPWHRASTRPWCVRRSRGSGAAGGTHDPILFGELIPIGMRSRGPKRNLPPADLPALLLRGQADQRPGRLRVSPIHASRGPAQPRTDSERRDGPLIRPPAPRARPGTGAGGKLKSKRKLSIRDTEFGFQTNPPDPDFGSPIAQGPDLPGPFELWFS